MSIPLMKSVPGIQSPLYGNVKRGKNGNEALPPNWTRPLPALYAKAKKTYYSPFIQNDWRNGIWRKTNTWTPIQSAGWAMYVTIGFVRKAIPMRLPLLNASGGTRAVPSVASLLRNILMLPLNGLPLKTFFPYDVTPSSTKTAWFLCRNCRQEYLSVIQDQARRKGPYCPHCRGN